ncbi:hypothetical protein Tco_0425980 [Tanacetum coccineum]
MCCTAKKPLDNSRKLATMDPPVDIWCKPHSAERAEILTPVSSGPPSKRATICQDCDLVPIPVLQGKTSQRDEMPQNSIQVCENLEHMVASTLMGPPFPVFTRNKYILRGSRLFVKMGLKRKHSHHDAASVVCKTLKSSLRQIWCSPCNHK